MFKSNEFDRSTCTPRSARRILLAAVVAPLALSAAASSASAAVSVHVLSPWANVWVIFGNTQYTNVSVTGDAAHVSTMQPSLSSFDMLSVDLPGGAPPLQAAEIDMFMSSVDIDSGFGSPVAQSSNWGIWVTGRGWGVHVIWNSSAALLRTGIDPDGTMHYQTFPGEVFPVLVEYTDPNGVVTNQSQIVQSMEFISTAPLPSPGAGVLLGMGGLLAARRRR